MILGAVNSKKNVSIRLTEERWLHIITSHREIDPIDFSSILDAVENPDAIFKGDKGELLAAKPNPRKENWLVVAYKEVDETDGFIITAYITTDTQWLFKRKILWSKKS